MSTKPSPELEDQAKMQQEQVQAREGMEEKLMQQGRSEDGARIEHVDEEGDDP